MSEINTDNLMSEKLTDINNNKLARPPFGRNIENGADLSQNAMVSTYRTDNLDSFCGVGELESDFDN